MRGADMHDPCSAGSRGKSTTILPVVAGLAVLALVNVVHGGAVRGADSLSAAVSPAPEISIQAFLDRTEVPQNRTATLVVELRWRGELDRYEASKVDPPVVSNLEIVGSGSSSRVEVDQSGQPVSVQTHRFSLKPKELGMAYIEPVVVLYTDTRTGISRRLSTQRLQLNVVDPVRERRGRHGFVYALGAVAIAAGGAVYYFRRTRGGVPEPAPEPELTWEEKLLAQLREEVDLRKSAFQLKEGYSSVSRIARSYLANRFGLGGLELTTDELLRELRQKEVDERLIAQAEELLRRCDQVRFGGDAGDPSELSRLAGVLEWWLTRPQL
jgi:hypothetical protein